MRLPLLLATAGILSSLVGAEGTGHHPAAPEAFRVPNREGARGWTGAGHGERPVARGADPVARLRDRLESGELALAYDSAHGYLPALLEALDVPTSSQGLVFSRTSLQTDRIAPWAPRAVYFNDEVYVGWVQESPFVEIASIDPERGARFYTLSQTDSVTPTFTRQTTTCLMCHESRSITGGVPGLIVRSVLTDRLGYFVTNVHEGATTDRTPLERRWGGWYVTGTHENATHAGNVRGELLSHEVPNADRYVDQVDLTAGGNRTDLSDSFYTGAYLSPYSDIVALMVLTHQAMVHNLITLAHEEGTDGAVERLVRAMLFVNEASLEGPIRGTSGFTEEFSARGPRDARGRSLREFDLETRLFRYPMSFMIYSASFAALPEPTKRAVGRRLDEVLSGRDRDPAFSHLSVADRQAIIEILDDTEPGLLHPATSAPASSDRPSP